MAIAVTVSKSWHDGKKFHAVGTLAFSGSYTTGGDTVDLSGGPTKSSRVPIRVTVGGQSGFIYKFAPGTTIANGKVLVFGQQPTSATTGIIALDQIAAAAYPAGVTGDTVDFEGIFDVL